ncbi:hypothetical protein QBE52_01530 [Clostridiaceae bacterium 35-E11]
MRFVYGYLKGFIFVAIIYIAVALTVIFLDPQEFSLWIIKYIKTSEYSKLKITIAGHFLMVLYGMFEWVKCKNEIKRRKRRRKTYE